MFEYNSKYCIMGMMSKHCQPFDNWRGFHKNKNNAASFDVNFVPDYPKISYSYIYEKPSIKPYYKNTQVVSKLDQEFFNLSGKKFREIRETRNKFDKIVKVKEYNKEDVLELIDRWDKISGDLYGWHRHSGYDRNFFNKYYDAERNNLVSRFYYINDRIVGYSVLHHGENCWEYLIRKTDNTVRNTCLYIDYKTFEQIFNTYGDFLVNWGASKGKLLKYKRKFPVFDERDAYFYKVIK